MVVYDDDIMTAKIALHFIPCWSKRTAYRYIGYLREKLERTQKQPVFVSDFVKEYNISDNKYLKRTIAMTTTKE